MLDKWYQWEENEEDEEVEGVDYNVLKTFFSKEERDAINKGRSEMNEIIQTYKEM